MKVELDRIGLEALVKGSQPYYYEFENVLVKKAGHDYRDQYGTTKWRDLNCLTDEELYELYEICRNSWSLSKNKN
jgi:hypothetical protein